MITQATIDKVLRISKRYRNADNLATWDAFMKKYTESECTDRCIADVAKSYRKIDGFRIEGSRARLDPIWFNCPRYVAKRIEEALTDRFVVNAQGVSFDVVKIETVSILPWSVFVVQATVEAEKGTHA